MQNLFVCLNSIVSYDAYCMKAKSGQERTQKCTTQMTKTRKTARHSHCLYQRQTNGVGVAARSRALARVIQPFSRSSIMQFKVERVQQFSCTRVISFGQSISLLQAAGPGRLESRLSFCILWNQGADGAR